MKALKELGLVRPSQPSDHSFPQDLLWNKPFTYLKPKAERRWSYVGDTF